MSLTPQDLARINISVLQMFCQPTCLCELITSVWFPETKIEFNRWIQLQIQPTPGAVYDWWQKKFPDAPIRNPQDNVDDAFRDLGKHMLAKAMGWEYKGVKRIITPQGDA